MDCNASGSHFHRYAAGSDDRIAPGDHISFEAREHNVLPETLRNWTLEHRLIGREIDITPVKPTLNTLNGKLN